MEESILFQLSLLSLSCLVNASSSRQSPDKCFLAIGSGYCVGVCFFKLLNRALPRKLTRANNTTSSDFGFTPLRHRSLMRNIPHQTTSKILLTFYLLVTGNSFMMGLSRVSTALLPWSTGASEGFEAWGAQGTAEDEGKGHMHTHTHPNIHTYTKTGVMALPFYVTASRALRAAPPGPHFSRYFSPRLPPPFSLPLSAFLSPGVT